MAKPKAAKPAKPKPDQRALTPEEEAEIEERFRSALKVALGTPAKVADAAIKTPKSAKSKKKES